MKKPVKIVLILVLIAIGIYAIRIVYGLFILSAVSSEDRLTIAEGVYEKCKEKDQEDCEYYLAKDLLDVFAKQRKEAIPIIFDSAKPELERVEALKNFYELSRAGENKPIDKEEALLYYAVAYIQEDPIPVDLSYTAFEYLLQSPVNDPRIVEALITVAKDTTMPADFRAQAIKSLGEAGIKEAADIFIQILKEDNDKAPHFTANQVLIDLGAIDKIPELLEISVDDVNPIKARASAAYAINEMVKTYSVDKDVEKKIITLFKPLLDHPSITIRSPVEATLEKLTGIDYYKEDEILTDDEADEVMNQIFSDW